MKKEEEKIFIIIIIVKFYILYGLKGPIAAPYTMYFIFSIFKLLKLLITYAPDSWDTLSIYGRIIDR